MKKLSKLAIATALTFGLMTVFALPVKGQTVTQTQEGNQAAQATCTTNGGSYGQNTTCTTNVNQNLRQNQTVDMNGRQVIVRNDGTVLAAHDTVNTGLNLTTSVAAGITLVTAMTGAVISFKKSI